MVTDARGTGTGRLEASGERLTGGPPPRIDGPDVGEFAVLDDEHSLVQVGARARVVRHDRQPLADGNRLGSALVTIACSS